MQPIAYIEKTQAYYRRKGGANDYRYAHHTDGPFQRPLKPLAASRLALISSAGFAVVPAGAPDPERYRGINIGEKDRVEVFDVPSDTPAACIRYVTGAHNRQDSPMRDPDAYFPVTRLRELRAAGRIGSLAENFLRIRPCYSQRKTRELDAPEVLRRCRAMGVDVALFAPVWPVCHQTVSLVARHLEAEGIPTVIMACARDITASAFPPRAVFSHYPLGNPAGRPFDPENQRAVIGAALALLETATAPGTIVDLPHRWLAAEGWEGRVYDDNH